MPPHLRITTQNIQVEISKVLHIPVGMMFMTEDEETKEPILTTITYGGVVIEEYESNMTPETFSKMIEAQESNATLVMNNMIANESAIEAARLLKPIIKDNNRDVV
jgi:hypothetical protein